MATMTQSAPPRIRTTITKETLPASDNSPADAKPSPFYDRDLDIVVNALTPEEWTGHIMRVYRSNEKWERGAGPVDNVFTGPFTEEDVRSRFGGGRYVLWLYGPPKRHNLVGRYQLELEGQPIVNSFPRNGNPAGQGDGSSQVALQALQMASNPEMIRLMMEMMRTAAIQSMEIMKSQMPVAQNPLQTLRDAKEILGVSSQPQNSMMDTIRFLKEIGVIGSPEKKGIDEILGLITTLKTSGLINSGVPKADLLSTFAANIPMLADRVVTGFQEIRLKAEADERLIRLQRGEIRPNDPNVITLEQKPAAPAQSPSAPTAAAPSSAEQQPVSQEVAAAIITQYHLKRLVLGIKSPDATGQDMYDYLVNAWPEVLDELAKFHKDGLLAFFKSREMQIQQLGCDILAEVGEDPRLPKMIEDFLRIAKENAAAEKAATN